MYLQAHPQEWVWVKVKVRVRARVRVRVHVFTYFLMSLRKTISNTSRALLHIFEQPENCRYVVSIWCVKCYLLCLCRSIYRTARVFSSTQVLSPALQYITSLVTVMWKEQMLSDDVDHATTEVVVSKLWVCCIISACCNVHSTALPLASFTFYFIYCFHIPYSNMAAAN